MPEGALLNNFFTSALPGDFAQNAVASGVSDNLAGFGAEQLTNQIPANLTLDQLAGQAGLGTDALLSQGAQGIPFDTNFAGAINPEIGTDAILSGTQNLGEPGFDEITGQTGFNNMDVGQTGDTPFWDKGTAAGANLGLKAVGLGLQREQMQKNNARQNEQIRLAKDAYARNVESDENRKKLNF